MGAKICLPIGRARAFRSRWLDRPGHSRGASRRHCAAEIPAPRQVAAATVGQFIAEYAAAVRIFATRAAFEFRAPPMAVTPLLNQLAERA